MVVALALGGRPCLGITSRTASAVTRVFNRDYWSSFVFPLYTIRLLIGGGQDETMSEEIETLRLVVQIIYPEQVGIISLNTSVVYRISVFLFFLILVQLGFYLNKSKLYRYEFFVVSFDLIMFLSGFE